MKIPLFCWWWMLIVGVLDQEHHMWLDTKRNKHFEWLKIHFLWFVEFINLGLTETISSVSAHRRKRAQPILSCWGIWIETERQDVRWGFSWSWVRGLHGHRGVNIQQRKVAPFMRILLSKSLTALCDGICISDKIILCLPVDRIWHGRQNAMLFRTRLSVCFEWDCRHLRCHFCWKRHHLVWLKGGWLSLHLADLFSQVHLSSAISLLLIQFSCRL